MVVCLERGADLHMAQLVPLPLTVSCFSKIQIVFAFLGGPGQRAVKQMCVCVWSCRLAAVRRRLPHLVRKPPPPRPFRLWPSCPTARLAAAAVVLPNTRSPAPGCRYLSRKPPTPLLPWFPPQQATRRRHKSPPVCLHSLRAVLLQSNPLSWTAHQEHPLSCSIHLSMCYPLTLCLNGTTN